jgi:hypothetical protein
MTSDAYAIANLFHLEHLEDIALVVHPRPAPTRPPVTIATPRGGCLRYEHIIRRLGLTDRQGARLHTDLSINRTSTPGPITTRKSR